MLDEPAGKVIYGKDEIHIVDDHGELQGTVALNENLTLHHWMSERARFKEELDRWKEFRGYQQTMEHKPLLNLSFDPGKTDQRLIDILVKLNDWREFQHYQQQMKLGNALMSIWSSTRVIKAILNGEVIPTDFSLRPEMEYVLENYFRHQRIFSRQKELETSQMQLAWIESQILEILAEACASLEADFPLQQQLETKLQQQANTFNQELKNLEAKPVRPIQYPDQSAVFAQRLCHWGSEITRLIHEHWEWRIFLKWRKNGASTEETASFREQSSSEVSPDQQICGQYVSYQRHQLDRARVWVVASKILLKLTEDDINTVPREHLYMLKSTISGFQADVEKFQHDVQIAESRVQSAEQQLAKLTSQRLSPTTTHIPQQANSHPQLPVSPLEPESTAGPTENPSLDPLSSSSTKDHRARNSIRLPDTGVPETLQLSNILEEEENTQAKSNDANKEKRDTLTEDFIPDRVMAHDTIQAMNAPTGLCPDKVMRDGAESGLLHTPRCDDKANLMTELETFVNTSSGSASEAHSKGHGTRFSKKSPLRIRKSPRLRKTRSAKQPDQAFSSSILRHAGKKPTRKAKAVTKNQTMALLRTTPLKESSTYSTPLRRSQRLKEKAAASFFVAAPQANTAKPLKPTRQKKVGKQSLSVQPPPRPA